MNYATPAVLAATTPICTINAVQTRPRSRREPQTEPRIEETHSHIFSRCLRCFWQQARLATKCIYPLDLGLMPRSWARLDRIQRGDGRDDGGKRRGCVPSSVTLTRPFQILNDVKRLIVSTTLELRNSSGSRRHHAHLHDKCGPNAPKIAA